MSYILNNNKIIFKYLISFLKIMDIMHGDPEAKLYIKGSYAFKRKSKQSFDLDYPISANMPKVSMWFVNEDSFDTYIHARENGKLAYPKDLSSYQQIELNHETYQTESEEENESIKINRTTFTLETSKEVGVYLIIVTCDDSIQIKNSEFHIMVANRDPATFPVNETDDLAEVTEKHLKIWDRYGSVWFVNMPFFYDNMLLIKFTPEYLKELLNHKERPEGFPYSLEKTIRIAQGWKNLGFGQIYIEVEKPEDDDDEIPCMELEYAKDVKPGVVS